MMSPTESLTCLVEKYPTTTPDLRSRSFSWRGVPLNRRSPFGRCLDRSFLTSTILLPPIIRQVATHVPPPQRDCPSMCLRIDSGISRSEEHTSELQSRGHLV